MNKKLIDKKYSLIALLIIGPLFLLTRNPCFSTPIEEEHKLPKIDRIVVYKSKRELTLYSGEKIARTYKVALGFNPIGQKEKEGDGKTPEGIYTICAKNPNSQFHKSLRISYPSAKDQKCAKENCVSPGGDIMVHGLGKYFSYLGKMHLLKDWTLGCVALTDEEITEIYDSVPVGTKIEINP